ncbi:MAG: zinc-binding dehydrogenase [Clostridia bacterium]|nr:zinc-binding dehydrogenase [Clostridia bacterium]
MKAVQFDGQVSKWIYSRAAGSLSRKAYYDSLSNIAYRDVQPPALPTPEWVRVKTRYAGFCGSDKNLILLHDSPSTSPFSSFPFTIGHENCGYVGEMGPVAAERLAGVASTGTRVLVDPILWCVPRGIRPVCENCAKGDYSLCTHFTDGSVSPGFSIGTCRDTGGGWSEEFVAHYSQLIPLPANVSFEDAVLVDAFCSSLHPVMRNFPADDSTALIIGCGVIGLSAVAAIRALGGKARIVVLAKHKFQGEAAKSFGANEVVYMRRDSDYYAELAQVLGAALLKPMMGKRVVNGGADIVFDCVGSSTSIDDALRFTKPRGTMALVGLASFPKGVDWTPIWLKEVQVRGSFWCSTEEFEGSRMRTYEVAVELVKSGRVRLSPLLTHKFKLADYKRAIEANMNIRESQVIKSVFEF